MGEIRITEQDGDVVEIVAEGKSGQITIVAEMTRSEDDLILNEAHFD